MATQTAAAVAPQQPEQQVTEHEARFLAGLRMLAAGIAGLLAGVVLAEVASRQGHGAAVALVVLCVLVFVASALVLAGLTRLWYAPEIAQAMLRQQQADAVVGARQRIVEGAVGMVELALQRLQDEGVVELDEERKASMVSNLLVVLCSEQATQPVVNSGTLYQ